MKPTAYLINTARGGIVDEEALYDVLQSNTIAGAAIDCFAVEPVVLEHPFGELNNVLLAPHSIAWTDELFRDIGLAACQGMVDLSMGKKPMHGVLNQKCLNASVSRTMGAVSCWCDRIIVCLCKKVCCGIVVSSFGPWGECRVGRLPRWLWWASTSSLLSEPNVGSAHDSS